MSRSSRRRAFTLTEVLAVLAIISVVAAIAFPAFIRAKARAKIADDLSRLHQCQIGVAMYQIDHEGQVSGPFALPSPIDFLWSIKNKNSFYGTTFETWTSACGWNPTSLSPRFVLFNTEDQAAARSYAAHGEHSILVADENCNDAGVDLRAQFVTKRGIGVLVDGTLVQRRHAGNIYSWEYWETGP